MVLLYLVPCSWAMVRSGENDLCLFAGRQHIGLLIFQALIAHVTHHERMEVKAEIPYSTFGRQLLTEISFPAS